MKSISTFLEIAALMLAACSSAPAHAPVAQAVSAMDTPLADVDNDGVLDVCDYCPRVPGINRGDHPFGRGCPYIDAFVSNHEPFNAVRFRRGEDKITSPLVELAERMKKLPSHVHVIVIGHTTNDEPADLSEKRAKAVVQALTALGVQNLEIHSAEDSHPIYGATQVDIDASRRADFDVSHDHARDRAWIDARRSVEYVVPPDLPCEIKKP